MDDGHQPDVGGFNPLNGLYFRDSNCLVQYFQLFIRRFQHSRLHHIVPLPLPLVLQSSSHVFSLPNPLDISKLEFSKKNHKCESFIQLKFKPLTIQVSIYKRFHSMWRIAEDFFSNYLFY